MPLHNRGGAEDVLVLRKRADHFVMEQATIAYFVPFTGSRALDRSESIRKLDEMSLWPELRDRPCGERKLWFGGPGWSFAVQTATFRAFLGRIDQDFVSIAEPFAFGLDRKSVV